ncbi:hypothetical protein [Acuticoccus mangrovi]|nr:hypothetical protein [Acuticoccus mangrovi]
MESFRDAAVRAAWWLGAPNMHGDELGVVIPRIAPMLDITRIEPGPDIDERVALRLVRMAGSVVPVASQEAWARQLLERAGTGDRVVITDRARQADGLLEALAELEAGLDADPARNPRDALAWIAAGDALHGAREEGAARAAWAAVRQATASARRITVVGPDVTSDERLRLAGEVLALDAVAATQWDRPFAGAVLVALDDPVRHLGPARTAAMLRDRLIALADRHRSLFVCVPRAAGAVMRARLPRLLWERLLLVDVAPRLDPGPATLIAAAASLADTVDVVGFPGGPVDLAADEERLHPAYAASRRGPADISDVLAAAASRGASVAALGRSLYPGLAPLHRGRAPTTIGGLGEALRAATGDRLVADGVRRLTLEREGEDGVVLRWQPGTGLPADPPLARFAPGGRSVDGVRPWPTEAHERVGALLDAVDRAMPEIVLSTPQPRRAEPADPHVTVAGLRSLLAPGEGPEGPFADDAEERAALLAHRRLTERDLDRVHSRRMDGLATRLTAPVFVAGPGFAWETINVARLRGAAVALVDIPPGRVPAGLAASPLLIVSTRAAARAQQGAQPRAVFLTALGAAHRGEAEDIVFDPAALALPDGVPRDPIALAVQLLRALRVPAIVPLGAAGVSLPAGDDVLVLDDPRRPGAEAARFHDLFRSRDWDGMPKLLLAVDGAAPLDLLERAVEGLGDRLLTYVDREDRVRLVTGHRLVAGAKMAVPAYTRGDPLVEEAVERFAPEIVIASAGVVTPGTGDAPRVVIGPEDDGADSVASVAYHAAFPAPPAAFEAEADALRLRLVAAARSAAEAAERARADAARRAEAAEEWATEEPTAGERAPSQEPPIVALPFSLGWLDQLRRRGRHSERAEPAITEPAPAAETEPAPETAPETISETAPAPVDAAEGSVSPPSSQEVPPTETSEDATHALFAAVSPYNWRRAEIRRSDQGRRSEMAEATTPKKASFSQLWPWPGNILLVLFAAWLFYMGRIAELADVRQAFYGLGGVTVLVLLLGLRAAFVRPRRGAHREERVRRREGRRAAAPDPAVAPPEVADPAFDAMPQNARARAAQAAADPSAFATVEEPPRAETPAETVAEPETAVDETPPPTQIVVPSRARPKREDLAATAQQLEGWINREKAERGAQIAKLNEQIEALTERLATLERETTEEFDAQLEPFLRIVAFNNAVNNKLLPRVENMIAKAIEGAMQPDALKAKVAAVLPEATSAGGDGGALKGELAAVRAAQQEDRKAIAALREAAARGGAGAGEAVEKRLAEAERRIEEMKTGFKDLTQHLSRMGDQHQALLQRIDGLSETVPARAGETGGPSEVEALRDALTTIIEQNREIRAQQEMLTARFDAPTRVGLDADRPKGG